MKYAYLWPTVEVHHRVNCSGVQWARGHRQDRGIWNRGYPQGRVRHLAMSYTRSSSSGIWRNSTSSNFLDVDRHASEMTSRSRGFSMHHIINPSPMLVSPKRNASSATALRHPMLGGALPIFCDPQILMVKRGWRYGPVWLGGVGVEKGMRCELRNYSVSDSS